MHLAATTRSLVGTPFSVRLQRATTALGFAATRLGIATALLLLATAGLGVTGCSGSAGGAAPGANAAAGPPPTSAVYRDLAYGTDSPAQKLDLFLPLQGATPYPIVVAIHGGGFLSGDKSDGQITPVLEALKRGYAVVSVNYRLSEEAHFPAAINDVKAAIRWLRAHALEYRLDGSRIALWGDSAGGNLAALAGTSGDISALRGPHPTDAGRSDRVQAVVDWFGPISFLRIDHDFRVDGFRRASAAGPHSFLSQYLGAPLAKARAKVKATDPITYITPDDPPVLIEHGTADDTVPVRQSKRFAKAYAAGVGAGSVTLHLIRGAGHVDRTFYELGHVNDVLDWLDSQLK